MVASSREQRRRCVAAAALLFRSIARVRQTRRAALFDRLKVMAQDQQDLLFASTSALLASRQEKEVRRVETRALGKWRGSTLSGYLTKGDDKTYLQNFRCTKAQFDRMVDHLQDSHLDSQPDRTVVGSAEWRKVRRTANARKALDPPSRRYKVAVALYSVGHGGSIKVLADVASLGKSTLKKYLEQWADACTEKLKPVYMPGKPPSAADLAAVQSEFASRRGLAPVAQAVDGSHIPWKPKGKALQMDYRNFKGWPSILAVAFVDSYYRFFELDVGWPGRAGDNTVLKHSWLMTAIGEDPDLWLGKGGVILGDSGASDGDQYFLNPYHQPTDAKKLWFNFCHSSTRFYVEQTFGMWKSRFRFLLYSMPQTTHKLFTKLIYASAIVHNFLVAHRGGCEFDFGADSEGAWSKFFEKHKAMRCPTCVRAKNKHCPHQHGHRNGAAQQVAYRNAPSVLREAICDKLWEAVCEDDATRVATERDMLDAHAQRRATQ